MGNGGKVIKKQLVILGIIILLLIVGLSGCEDEDTSQNDIGNIERIILGSWKWVETIITIDGNTTSYNDTEFVTICTFYDNGTYKTESNGSLLNWVNYEIKNNDLFTSMYDLPPNRIGIDISRDGKYLSLTTIGVYPDGRMEETIARYIRLE